MRPIFSLWSDYRRPTRNYRMSASARVSSIGRKIFLTAIIVAAAVIGIRELYGQAVDKRGAPEALAAHPQSTPSVNATGKRFANVAAIPLSPQPVVRMDNGASPAPTPEAAPAEASKVSGDRPLQALATVPSAMAKASALPPPAAFAARKAADQPKGAGVRRVVRVAHHPRGDHESFGGYAEAIARLAHSNELRAALRSFL
jgi:hypothetical protein